MIYEGKEEPIDSIDFDIVANEMEEEVENENENTMVANEGDDNDNKIDYNPSLYDLYTHRYSRQKKWYRPFSDDKENRPIINTIVKYRRRKIVRKNRGVSGEKAIDKTRRFQMCDDITGVQSLCCIILLSINHSIEY